MATETAQQILDASVDTDGLSIVSAPMTTEVPRAGSMYNPVVLAAGVPIWFHPLQNGQFVAVFRSHWIAATVGADGPQSYSAHTEAGSCWVRVAPPTGGTTRLGAIPTRLPGETMVINGACSRAQFLYTVGNLDGVALVQAHLVSVEDVLNLQGEEMMFASGNNGVTFDRGCYIDGDHLVVLGADVDNNLYQCRRRSSLIGQVPPGPGEFRPGRSGVGGYAWEYRSAKGWLPDPSTLVPIGLTSLGPVSVAKYRDRRLVATVAKDSGVYTAQVFATRTMDTFGKWKSTGDLVPLGTDGTPTGMATFTARFGGAGGLTGELASAEPTAAAELVGAGELSASAIRARDITYLGGTLYFQDQLTRNSVIPLAAGAAASFPYVSSLKAITDEEQSIHTAWGLWSVR